MQGVKFTSKEVQKAKKDIVEYIKSSCHGTLTAAAAFAKISIAQVYIWREQDPGFDDEIKQARIKARETGLDFAENQLIKNIKDGGTAELIFYLKTQGKSRGYVDSPFTKENPLHVKDLTNIPDSELDNELSALARAVSETAASTEN